MDIFFPTWAGKPTKQKDGKIKDKPINIPNKASLTEIENILETIKVVSLT